MTRSGSPLGGNTIYEFLPYLDDLPLKFSPAIAPQTSGRIFQKDNGAASGCQRLSQQL